MQHLCPNCGEDLDDRDEPVGDFECPECGYTAYYRLIAAGYLTLDALNDLRKEHDLEPFAKLPERDKTLIKNPKPESE